MKFFNDPTITARLDEDIWFKVYQKELLGIANTKYGRDLLCIPQEYPEIVEISKRHVKAHLGYGVYKSDFRIGAKWANVIRYRWERFTSYLRYFQANNFPEAKYLSAATKAARAVHATTSTFYPDPNPETTTVDGTIRNQAAGGWSSVQGAATGTTAFDSLSVIFTSAEFVSGTTFNIDRAFMLWDTAAIPDTDDIASATVDFFIDVIENGINDANSYTTIVGLTSPASNTALATADFDQCGAIDNPTKFSNDVDHDSLTDEAYYSWTINATGLANISKTGITKWGWRMGHDIVDSTPGTGTVNEINADSADASGTSQDPRLVVIHAAPSSARFLPVLGIGV